MTWDDYYSRFWDLAPSTQRSYSYKLSDFGSAEEVFEVLNEFALEDDGFATHFATKALNAGVRFTPDHVLEMTILVEKTVLNRMAVTANGKFSREQLEEIYGLIDDSSYEIIARKANIDIFVDNYEEDEPETEDTYEPEENLYDEPVRKGPGFWKTLFAILAAFGSVSSKKKKDTGRCDGDCANCPAHYGYRYGRWYYGHGHQHGCERGGNGGASGRTYRD